MSIIDEAETMSLTGKSGGVAIKGLSEHELRTVMYLVGYPNLLVSLHPDYVMTHLMTPLAVDRTHVECAWAFPKDVAAKPDFDPSYAVDFWDLTNRQDWARLRVGAARPHLTARAARAAGPRRGRRLPVRHAGSLRRTPVPLIPRRHPVDAVDRLGVAAHGEGHRRGHDLQRVPVDVVDRVARGVIVRSKAIPGWPPQSRACTSVLRCDDPVVSRPDRHTRGQERA